jgi:hypothetical protein
MSEGVDENVVFSWLQELSPFQKTCLLILVINVGMILFLFTIVTCCYCSKTLRMYKIKCFAKQRVLNIIVDDADPELVERILIEEKKMRENPISFRELLRFFVCY